MRTSTFRPEPAAEVREPGVRAVEMDKE